MPWNTEAERYCYWWCYPLRLDEGCFARTVYAFKVHIRNDLLHRLPINVVFVYARVCMSVFVQPPVRKDKSLLEFVVSARSSGSISGRKKLRKERLRLSENKFTQS